MTTRIGDPRLNYVNVAALFVIACSTVITIVIVVLAFIGRDKM
jgi:hypothetical protein